MNVAVKTISGTSVEISHEEAQRIAREIMPKSADHADFIAAYHDRAAHNLKCALDMDVAPRSEEQVKSAIAAAFCHCARTGDWELLAEVLYESMEFESSHFADELENGEGECHCRECRCHCR